MTNSADPDQLASSEANWSGSTLFAKIGISSFSRTRVKICWSLNQVYSFQIVTLDSEKKQQKTHTKNAGLA